uniref:Quaternary amine transport ATP-binding protein n=1 Tax=Candidatus Kentrum sp. TUN TaxID=2126343 RepID=A0A451AK17_9GAMM|nr:MAG: glycine betaine/proline transport system ATP-binding protein [Candidatus Kentron sp. TUN]VFK60977.1 MAG: glycine betaine/proline transport system ATP-binding protein [Candidatus Kentron sp. TUN]VFK66372.1 MAG: glycine betaine/proline transport system ATP-binding protein [Candidatus Kentron sp. TUN]
MKDKLVIRNLYKIYGPEPDKAWELLESGLTKDEIFARTRTTIGVQNANFTVREGEVFVIMGLSGSGKSTLVRMFNRLIEPTYGEVLLDGMDVVKMNQRELIHMRRTQMSMVFQSFALLPHKTVAENTAFGLEISAVGQEERRHRALRALETVGLRQHADSYPEQLSGGMKQRVGLARALATEAPILLMDEAFSALDPLIRTGMQDELVRLQQREAHTIIFISHDLDEAIRIGDRIAIMEGGAVVQIGTPEDIVTNPANEYVRSFFYGVDVSKVFSARDIAEDGALTIFEQSGLDIRAALARLHEQQDTLAVVLDGDRYRGMVSTSSLAHRVAEKDNQVTDSQAEWEGAFLAEVTFAAGDLDLSEVLSLVAESEYPVPVVDEAGKYLGIIDRRILLQTLNKTS